MSFLISKIINTVPITPNFMASSVSQSDESIHVSLINFNRVLVLEITLQSFVYLLFLGIFCAIAFFFIMLLSHDWNAGF